jgi:hypothetical protein
MTEHWRTWLLVSTAVVLLLVVGRLDLLALVAPLSAVAAFGAWLAKPGNASRGQ